MLFISSCSSEPQRPQPATPSPSPNAEPGTPNFPRVPIGASGFSIELPPTHTIRDEFQQKDTSWVYYIAPLDTLAFTGEAGIYIGPHPQVRPPEVENSARTLTSPLLGMDRTWIEYATPMVTQRETFIDEGNGKFLHVWCYAENLEELENLFKMVATISR